MLELLGGLLLFFLLVTLTMVWLGVRLARNVARRLRGLAASWQTGMPGFAAAMPDQRWMRLSAHFDRRQREQARIARERIALLLAERGSAALTPEEAQLMISCEKRVPELIDTCLERCRSARPAERCNYAGPTLDRLVRIGEEADAARQRIRGRDDGQLTTIHRYFDAVTEGRPPA